MNHATKGSTNSECEAPRCSVMSWIGSLVKRAISSPSRSGSVPSAAPASSAARRCAGGAMAAATAPPKTICERESTAMKCE